MSRPFVVWVSMVFSGMYALAAAWWLLRGILMLPLWLQAAGALRVGTTILFQACVTAFLVAVVYAGGARPRWGHAVSSVFALLFSLLVVYRALHPDPHPLFAIRGDAEQRGARMGHWSAVILVLLQAGFMMFGAKARNYFTPRLGQIKADGAS